MTRNPVINALAASAYIGGIALFINFASQMPDPEMPFAPSVMLSLLVLSVLVMGYLFFMQPIMLYIEGDKIGAVRLFGRSILSFALITAAWLITIFIIG